MAVTRAELNAAIEALTAIGSMVLGVMEILDTEFPHHKERILALAVEARRGIASAMLLISDTEPGPT